VTWHDDLLRVTHPDGRRLVGASFRGVAFFVDEVARAGGRRIVTHEFPLRDDPAIEDLGRVARTFPLEGYVLGDDYHRQRDALLAVLEDVTGPGELVHPYYGVRRAVCASLSLRESTADGGIARFSLEFVEVPAAAPVPVEVEDVAAAVDTSADAALESVELELEEELDVEDEPGFATESLAADLVAVVGSLGEGFAAMELTVQELAQLDVEIQTITDEAATIVSTPADTVASLVTVLESVAETAAEAPRDFLHAVLAAYDVDEQPAAQGESDTRALERENQVVFSAALRRVLAVEAARVLPTVVYETIEDATEDRDAVAERLEEQALTAGDDAYPLLVRLRADVLRAVPGDSVLARLVTVQRPVAVPSLLLSYQVYGEIGDLEERVVARNRASHPGFMAGELKVLSRV
jgi:prophage DNA circulation protein